MVFEGTREDFDQFGEMVDGNLIGLVDFNNDFTGNYT
jgi:hypothetical protein